MKSDCPDTVKAYTETSLKAMPSFMSGSTNLPSGFRETNRISRSRPFLDNNLHLPHILDRLIDAKISKSSNMGVKLPCLPLWSHWSPLHLNSATCGNWTSDHDSKTTIDRAHLCTTILTRKEGNKDEEYYWCCWRAGVFAYISLLDSFANSSRCIYLRDSYIVWKAISNCFEKYPNPCT